MRHCGYFKGLVRCISMINMLQFRVRNTYTLIWYSYKTHRFLEGIHYNSIIMNPLNESKLSSMPPTKWEVQPRYYLLHEPKE